MTTTFIDTSFVLALVLKNDAHHVRAGAWQRRTIGPLLTIEFVLAEVADALATASLRLIASSVISAIRGDARIQVVPASTAILDRALALYTSRSDKDWGLTDCVSFTAMRDAGVFDALTSDHHFEQAGFRALLRVDAGN